MITDIRRTEEYVNSVPDYLKNAWEKKNGVSLRAIFNQRRVLKKKERFWSSAAFLWTMIMVLPFGGLLLAWFATSTGNANTELLEGLFVFLLLLGATVLVIRSSIRKADLITDKIAELDHLYNSFVQVVQRWGFDSSESLELGSRLNKLRQFVEDRLMLEWRINKMRPDTRFSNAELLDVIRQYNKMEFELCTMFGVAEELDLRNPEDGKPIRRDEIFREVSARINLQ